MKFNFLCRPVVAVEVMRKHAEINRARGLPGVECRDRPPLAVVGGGHSLAHALDELRAWTGEIWACGSPYQWLTVHAIESVFFNADPMDETIDLARGASKALLADTVNPGVFDVVGSAEIFDLNDYGHGNTSASISAHLAISRGHKEVTYFGCDSSFEGSTHLYKDEDWEAHILVECNGQQFRTKPQLLMQAEMLSAFIRMAPHVFKERSGGLLSAMVESEDYDVIAGNAAMHGLLKGHSPQAWYEANR